MKKLAILMIVMMMSLSFTACGGGGDDKGDVNQSDTGNKGQEEVKPADLTGEWKQVNVNSEESYQTAVIQDEVIEVYWFDATTDTQSLYWAGSYIAPTTADEPYSWDSVNDKEKTGSAMLASGDDTKTFTYSDGQISYSVSALGSTQTVKLEKQ